ncbi:EF hand domain containing protein [Nitzschia inconspicua]|uniref:EF hand domain containing protein n=1 Tax=Nitzschia inconspicua TaxID=303405 RepID=A0A9K3PZS3_9STRA|nr:EF hand domain containing protein [Nitzschia inconspicua]KAG7365591.1 EF hand domain containing protein [Nitzschia inconspicua]
MSELRSSFKKTAAKHNAYKVAAASKQAQAPQGPSAFSRISKDVIKMQILLLSMQLELLEDLEPMNDEEKLQALFDVLDKDGDGSLSAVELADGLRKIRGDVDFEQSIALAMERVAEFDKDGDGKFQLSEFKEYVDTLCEALGTNFHELSEMLIISVVFNDVGNDAVEDFTASLLDEDITAAIQEEEKLRKFMDDERMVVLFHLFDSDMSGSVSFQEVVMGIYKITEDLDGAAATAVAALLLFDDDGSQTLDYAQFTKFILQLIAAADMPYNEAIFSLTEAAARDDPETLTMEELNKRLSSM